MIVPEFDPFLDPSSRLAGFAKLTALDGAERLMATVRDSNSHPTDRIKALSSLFNHSPHLGVATATGLIADAAEAVRGAAADALALHQPTVEPDAVG